MKIVNLAMGCGGVIIRFFYLLFSCFRACRSFLSKKNQQEKTGNRLVRGYTPPPYWQNANIFPVFSYEGFPYVPVAIGEDMLMLALAREEEARELEPMVNGKICVHFSYAF